MTPTDELRAMLDERGIEWWYGIGEKSTVFDGEYGVRYEVDGTLGLLFIRSVLNVTPEQAIAATVGEEHEMHICKRCGVAYELNIIDKGFGKPRFCPNCGYRELYQ